LMTDSAPDFVSCSFRDRPHVFTQFILEPIPFCVLFLGKQLPHIVFIFELSSPLTRFIER
ncbi:hypothetical protein DVK07_20080, partial [Halorubrum sp. Atlit-26R]